MCNRNEKAPVVTPNKSLVILSDGTWHLFSHSVNLAVPGADIQLCSPKISTAKSATCERTAFGRKRATRVVGTS
jgi:hypothetical protein